MYASDGDALTITEDTAGKARFRNFVKISEGKYRLMTDEEYAVKLRAETHIDELSQVSKRGKKIVPDSKIIPLRKTVLITEPRIFLTMTASITE